MAYLHPPPRPRSRFCFPQCAISPCCCPVSSSKAHSNSAAASTATKVKPLACEHLFPGSTCPPEDPILLDALGAWSMHGLNCCSCLFGKSSVPAPSSIFSCVAHLKPSLVPQPHPHPHSSKRQSLSLRAYLYFPKFPLLQKF
jgi:hypothetical protein